MVTRQQVDEQKALNIERAECPQPGDYWDEMFAPVALVLDVTPFHVTYLGDTKDTDRRHWTWNVEKVTVKSRTDFKKWISYGSIPGTWADVTPRWKHFEDFRDAAVQHASGVGTPRGQTISRNTPMEEE